MPTDSAKPFCRHCGRLCPGDLAGHERSCSSRPGNGRGAKRAAALARPEVRAKMAAAARAALARPDVRAKRAAAARAAWQDPEVRAKRSAAMKSALLPRSIAIARARLAALEAQLPQDPIERILGPPREVLVSVDRGPWVRLEDA